MKTTSIGFPWRENAFALALGLAIIGIGAGLAHSQTPAAQNAATQPTTVQTQQAAAPGFICQAHPGDWCDLRDWSGYAQAFSQPESPQPQAK